MKRAGCFRLRYGIESGDPRILKIMRKEISLDMARRVFRLSRKVGLQRFAYFIIGYYSDNEESIRNTINFAKEIDPDWVMFTAATPLPNTNLFELCVSDGLVDKNYWLAFMKGRNDGRMNYLVKDTEKWIKTAYKEVYLRPSYIMKKIARLRDPCELLNYVKGAIAIIKI
jgi:anaerobic magnesium-protoporphyrin IX monomethyl ester cyclase